MYGVIHHTLLLAVAIVRLAASLCWGGIALIVGR